MPAPVPSDRPPSLLAITVRRSTTMGRFFLVYGTGISILLGALLALTAASAFSAAFPLLLPIFGAVGSMGGLTVFSSDRTKGAIEYFLAYGVSPRRLFANVLVACLVAVTVILAVGVSVGLGLYVASGNSISGALLLALGGYAIPMTYASAAFATMSGMYWTALSSPSTAMNSPIGLAPFVGILPPVSVLAIVTALGISGNLSPSGTVDVAIVVMAVVAATAVLLLALIGPLLRTERLLSPA